MLKPEEWDMVMRPLVPTTHAKKVVAEHARAFLQSQHHVLTTNQLVEALYPRAVADQSLAGDEARDRIYKLLAALAVDDLHDCAQRGEPDGRKFMGRPTRPWLWHAPKAKESCPMCGQSMPEDGK